jgi:hypothetical protein
LRLAELASGAIWEAAAGGLLVDALRFVGRGVIATDIERHRHDIARVDYLRDAPAVATRGALMITYPPVSRVHHPPSGASTAAI